MKGFFLSLDALTALVIAMLVFSVTAMPSANNSPVPATIVLADKAHDDAVLGFYSRTVTLDPGFSGHAAGVCVLHVLPKTGNTNIENTPVNRQADVQAFSYCRVSA